MLPSASHPVIVSARLDAPLSRWLWLVKWILAVPHYIVLFFLWTAFAVVSVMAFFAILFTERYPRPLFDFNVGVLRRSWPVSYYAYGALGAGRYPPFSLGPERSFPAQLDVPCPERLSRGLVLVKWWLLAIPHHVVIGLDRWVLRVPAHSGLMIDIYPPFRLDMGRDEPSDRVPAPVREP
jgi:hypothetical protein